MKQITSIVLLALSSLTANATVKYVKAGATGANNGTSWANAYTDLQSALTTAITGDEVWVAAGVYKPTTTTTRSISFNIPNGVAVYGGFAGTELTVASRNIAANATILSGDIGAPGTATDNTTHVVKCTNVNNQTRLDGFKIIAGYADAGTSNDGGGILITSSSPTISKCAFTTNYATFGGAISCTTSGTVVFDSCSITGNNAVSAGAGFYNNGNLTCKLTDCVINDNISNSSAGGAYFNGGIVTLERCIFSGNSAGTGVGGAFATNNDPSISIYNSLIVGNTAFYYGAFEMGNITGGGNIVNCTISNNKTVSATVNDVAVYPGTDSKVANCIIWGNTPTRQMAGVTTNVTNTTVQGGYTYNGNPIPVSTFDPSFVLAGNVVSAPFNANSYDYSLKTISQAIDMGNNASIQSLQLVDILHGNRTHGGTVDMGAYENIYCPLTVNIVASGPTTFCSGDSVTLSVTGGTGYLWSTGAQTSSIKATVDGTYNVVVVNGTCRGTNSMVVNVMASPTPVITVVPTNTLKTGIYTQYQWYLGSNAIGGATNQTYQPGAANGTYFVKVWEATGCYATSPGFAYTQQTGQGVSEMNGLNDKLAIYPNPAHGQAVVDLGALPEGVYSLSVSDVSGKKILSSNYTVSTQTKQAKIDVSGLAEGIYLLEVKGGNLLMKGKLSVY